MGEAADSYLTPYRYFAAIFGANRDLYLAAAFAWMMFDLAALSMRFIARGIAASASSFVAALVTFLTAVRIEVLMALLC